MQRIRIAAMVVICAGTCFVCRSNLEAASPDELVASVRAVDREGKGNAEAHRAAKELTAANANVLPTILVGFADANPLAENWLRGVFESVADRAVKQGDFPAKEIEGFVLDRKQSPRARRLAFEWLVRVDDSAADRLIPKMIDDPSPDFRRDAVARLVVDGDKLLGDQKTDQAAETFSRALAGAVDDDQVKPVVNALRKLGKKVDLPRHFGFITNWQMIGPFDNQKGVGFAAVYAPENEIDLKKKYAGQTGEVAWSPVSTEHDYGLVDIAKQVAPYKGAVMYAYCDFHSSERRDVELRLGTPNAWVIWVNGKKVFGRQEYHRGMALDQYRVNVTLQPGNNTILLKICQNEMEFDWAQRYQFQLRVCEPSGVAVLSQDQKESASIDSTNSRK